MIENIIKMGNMIKMVVTIGIVLLVLPNVIGADDNLNMMIPLDTSVPIGFGDNITSSIGSPAELDAYVFTANSTDTVYIRMGASWYDYPQIRLYAPNGTLIGSQTSLAYYQELTKKLDNTGIYTILIGDADSDNTGNYGIYLQRTNMPRKNISITAGNTKSDTVNNSIDMDTYSFTAYSGDNILIRMGASWYDYPQIRLYAPNGTLIGSSASLAYNQELTKKLDVSGRYNILIGDGDGDNSGAYNMYFQILNRPGNKTSIESGDTISSSINPSSEMDTYVFNAYSGDNVLIRMGASWYDYPQIRLYAPNGSLIGSSSSLAYNQELTKTLNANGEYKILIGDGDSDNTGSYSLYFQLFKAYPSGVTNLKNKSYAPSYINWTWTDPGDLDFAKVMIYINGVFKGNVTKGKRYYNATNLIPNVTYTIGTNTVDTEGNVNPERVSNASTTARDYIPPNSVTNLKNISYAPNYIKWTWTDPTDIDLKYVSVYVNGIFIKNVPKGTRYANVTNLLPNYDYKIMTRTIDTSGNVNATWKTHMSRTSP